MNTEGKTTIAPDVLLQISRLACLGVPGVSRIYTSNRTVNRMINKAAREGIEIDVQEDTVNVDLHVVMFPDLNIREVSYTIQQEVSRAIADMVGMDVGRINVHVEDIDYPLNKEG